MASGRPFNVSQLFGALFGGDGNATLSIILVRLWLVTVVACIQFGPNTGERFTDFLFVPKVLQKQIPVDVSRPRCLSCCDLANTQRGW